MFLHQSNVVQHTMHRRHLAHHRERPLVSPPANMQNPQLSARCPCPLQRYRHVDRPLPKAVLCALVLLRPLHRIKIRTLLHR